MTAEIAIMNKSAVVLAADSAVTIGSGGGAKIFNTANKIFEISDGSHIGLMIFNSLEFMGLPLEVLAKEFRRERGGKKFATVNECRTDFLSYLGTEVGFSDGDKDQNFMSVAHSAMIEANRNFDRALNIHVRETGRVLVSKFNGVLKGALEEMIEDLKSLDKADGFVKVALSDHHKAMLYSSA